MRRRILYLVGLTVAVAMLVWTGAFSSAAADRTAGIAVAPDEHAYLGIERGPSEAVVGESLDVLELSDNFASDVDLDGVRIVESTAPVSLVAPTNGADLGESTPITVSCDDVGDGTVTFEIFASGDGVEVTATRTVGVSCNPVPIAPSDVTFIGCGNAEIDTHSAHFPLDVTLIGYDATGVSETGVTVGAPGDRTGGSQGQLIGLEIRDADLVVTNPNYDFDAGSCENASLGNPATAVTGDPREHVD